MRPSIRPKRERGYRSNSLRISAIGLKLGGRCTVTWSRSLFKMAMLCQFLCVSQNFEIFYDRLGPGLRDDDSYYETWWNHTMAWKSVAKMQCTTKWITSWNGYAQSMFAFSDFGRPMVLSFSERLVCFGNNKNSTLHTMFSIMVESLDNVTSSGNQLWKHWFSCLKRE